MTEEAKNMQQPAGETVVTDEVAASVAGIAAQQVSGVNSLGSSAVRRAVANAFADEAGKARSGVTVEVGEHECVVDLDLNVQYGYSIPTIINEVREKVSVQLLEITGLVAKEINVRVVGVEMPPEEPQPRVE